MAPFNKDPDNPGGVTKPPGSPTGPGGGQGQSPAPYQPGIPLPKKPPTEDPGGGGGRRRAVGPPPTPPRQTTPLPRPSKDPTPILPQPVPRIESGPSRTDTFIPSMEPLPVIYGKTRTGGMVVFEKVNADGSKTVVWWICHGPINSIANIIVDGKSISHFGLIANTDYFVYTGTPSQTVNALVVASDARHTSGWPGIAYIAARFPKPGFATNVAPDVRRMYCDVEGMLVRDPRTDPTLVNRYYRDNPWLCTADYMTSKRYGGAIADSSILWTGAGVNGSVEFGANAADANIGGGVKRFLISLKIDQKRDYEGWLETIRAGCQMMAPVYNDGKYQLPIDIVQSASGITLTDQGTAANITSAGPLMVSGSAKIFTRVRVSYVNRDAEYKDDWAEDEDPALASGVVDLNLKEYDLQLPTFDQAKRIAKYIRKRSLLDESAPIRANQEATQLLPGMRIAVTSGELGWTAKDALVTNVRPAGPAWFVDVEEYAAGTYDDTPQSTTSEAPPTNQSPFDTPPEATGISFNPASPSYLSSQDHAVLTFTQPNTSFYKNLEIYIEFSTDNFSWGTRTLFVPVVVTSPYTLPSFPNGAGYYRMTIVTVNTRDVRSTGAVVTYQVNAASFGQGMVISGFMETETGALVTGQPAGLSCATVSILDKARFFGWASGGYEQAAITTNAVWDGTQWLRDDVAKRSWRMQIDAASDYLAFYRAAAAANPITNWTEFVRINASGNVGIGIAPTDKLDVLGLVSIRGVSGSPNYLRFDNTANAGGKMWRLGDTGAVAFGHFSLWNQTDSVTAIVVTPGAQVGIGISPLNALHVKQFGSIHTMVQIEAGTDGYPQVGFYENASLKWNLYNEFANDNFAFGNSGGPRFQISPAGNIGVGMNPQANDRAAIAGGSVNHIAMGAWAASPTWTAISVTGALTLADANILGNAQTGQPLIINRGVGRALSFRESNVEQMYFATSTGNATFYGSIGVGGAPNAPLDVYGASAVSAQFRTNDASGGYAAFWDTTASTTRGFVGFGATLFTGAASTEFGIRSQGALVFSTGGAPIRLVIDGSNGHTRPGAHFAQDLGLDATRWRSLYAAELRVQTLIAQNTIATIGGRILVGPTCKLVLDIATVSTTITVDNNQMTVGDRIYMESAPGGVQQIEFMAVIGGPTTVAQGFNYDVTRNLDATGANEWKAGDAVFNTGQTGSGFIDIYSVRGTKASSELGPTIVGNVRNSATFNDWSPRWAIGNLNGLYGYATNTYGVAMGVPTAAWVKIDPTNGVRIGHNAATKISLDASGNASFTGSITAASGTIGGFTIGATELFAGTGATRVQMSSTSGFWAGADAFASAPFSVSQAGVLKATSGTVGGWTLASTTLTGGNATLDSTGNLTLGTGNDVCRVSATDSLYRLWIGNTAPGSASFAVTKGGSLNATNAVISGNVSATAGTIGGWTVGASSLTGGSIVLDASNGWITFGSYKLQPHGLGIESNGDFICPGGLIVGGNYVVQGQQANVADTSGATLGQLETSVNSLKAMLRAHGLMG
jgi:hypothetical protein